MSIPLNIGLLRELIYDDPDTHDLAAVADRHGYESRFEQAWDHLENEDYCNGDMSDEEALVQWQPPAIEGWGLLETFISDDGDMVAHYIRPKEVRNETV